MSPTEPDLPRDPAGYRPKPLLGVGFWVMVAFGLVCVLAGVAVTLLGPRWMPAGPEAAKPVTPVPAQRSVASLTPLYPANAEPGRVTLDEVGQLKARIAVLEGQGARSTEAATAALAAAALTEATQGSRPFVAEYEALRAEAPNLPELTGLSRLAETGAPSRGALAISFEALAAKAASRSRKPPQDAGLGARIAYAAGKVVTIRQVDDVEGDSPDALVARADLALKEGEVVAALALLDRLPPKGRAALASWREGAERRAVIDRVVAALRLRAVRDLSPASGAMTEVAP